MQFVKLTLRHDRSKKKRKKDQKYSQIKLEF